MTDDLETEEMRQESPHSPDNQLRYEDLVPGHRYRVSWQDCCAKGWFEGVLVGQNEWEIQFDCGMINTVADGQTWITATVDHD